MIEALADRMQRSATGFACVCDGVLDVRTVADHRQIAAMRGLAMRSVFFLPCMNEDCDCAVKAAEALGLKIVAVSVEATA